MCVYTATRALQGSCISGMKLNLQQYQKKKKVEKKGGRVKKEEQKKEGMQLNLHTCPQW